MAYEYKCKILRIVDGDTVDVDIDLGFGIWMHRERVRIMGIDTPESRTRDKVEKQFGLAAKAYLKELLPIGSIQTIKTQKDKTGKFGRILGDFEIEYKDFKNNFSKRTVTSLMLENNHAVPYKGQSKEELVELHLINREKLKEKGLI
jgi:micrococcal nuclease